MANAQNYFIQITIQKGRLIESNGDFVKVVDEVLKDDMITLNDESEIDNLKNKLLENGNLDFEEVQKTL